jgi:hypothetical protein
MDVAACGKGVGVATGLCAATGHAEKTATNKLAAVNRLNVLFVIETSWL